MLHAKKNHLLDDEELMRLDTCRDLHGKSSPRFIDWIPSCASSSQLMLPEPSLSKTLWRSWHEATRDVMSNTAYTGRFRMVLDAPILGANQADRQISIDIPLPLFNEFLCISCTLALIVSALPQSCSANLTPIIEHFLRKSSIEQPMRRSMKVWVSTTQRIRRKGRMRKGRRSRT